MIGIINYGSGNIHAIARIYKKLNIPYFISNKENELRQAGKLILPGVGDFDETIDLLEVGGLRLVLDDLVLNKKTPVLGVCVGMHIMAKSSEEGEKSGLGWLNANVKLIDKTKITSKPYLPHMGWNNVAIVKEHSVFNNVNVDKGFYFLHSYYFDCIDKNDILCTTDYGVSFPSGVNHNNIFGFQFHPEKSHNNGVSIFENFAKL